MFSITQCTTIPEEFDALFDECLPILEAGTFDWRYMGGPESDHAKREKMREAYEEYLNLPNGKVLAWRKDGKLIHLAAGLITPDDQNYILWGFALYGSDISGSKGWLHDSTYINETKGYFRETMGLLGYKISCHHGSSLYNYHISKAGASETYEVTEESTLNPHEVMIATIKYRYL
jgi:hypothetical protein